eukprot:gene27356-34066_t
MFCNLLPDGEGDVRTVHQANPVSDGLRKFGINIWLCDKEMGSVEDATINVNKITDYSQENSVFRQADQVTRQYDLMHSSQSTVSGSISTSSSDSSSTSSSGGVNHVYSSSFQPIDDSEDEEEFDSAGNDWKHSSISSPPANTNSSTHSTNSTSKHTSPQVDTSPHNKHKRSQSISPALSPGAVHNASLSALMDYGSESESISADEMSSSETAAESSVETTDKPHSKAVLPADGAPVRSQLNKSAQKRHKTSHSTSSSSSTANTADSDDDETTESSVTYTPMKVLLKNAEAETDSLNMVTEGVEGVKEVVTSSSSSSSSAPQPPPPPPSPSNRPVFSFTPSKPLQARIAEKKRERAASLSLHTAAASATATETVSLPSVAEVVAEETALELDLTQEPVDQDPVLSAPMNVILSGELSHQQAPIAVEQGEDQELKLIDETLHAEPFEIVSESVSDNSAFESTSYLQPSDEEVQQTVKMLFEEETVSVSPPNAVEADIAPYTQTSVEEEEQTQDQNTTSDQDPVFAPIDHTEPPASPLLPSPPLSPQSSPHASPIQSTHFEHSSHWTTSTTPGKTYGRSATKGKQSFSSSSSAERSPDVVIASSAPVVEFDLQAYAEDLAADISSDDGSRQSPVEMDSYTIHRNVSLDASNSGSNTSAINNYDSSAHNTVLAQLTSPSDSNRSSPLPEQEGYGERDEVDFNYFQDREFNAMDDEDEEEEDVVLTNPAASMSDLARAAERQLSGRKVSSSSSEKPLKFKKTRTKKVVILAAPVTEPVTEPVTPIEVPVTPIQAPVTPIEAPVTLIQAPVTSVTSVMPPLFDQLDVDTDAQLDASFESIVEMATEPSSDSPVVVAPSNTSSSSQAAKTPATAKRGYTKKSKSDDEIVIENVPQAGAAARKLKVATSKKSKAGAKTTEFVATTEQTDKTFDQIEDSDMQSGQGSSSSSSNVHFELETETPSELPQHDEDYEELDHITSTSGTQSSVDQSEAPTPAPKKLTKSQRRAAAPDVATARWAQSRSHPAGITQNMTESMSDAEQVERLPAENLELFDGDSDSATASPTKDTAESDDVRLTETDTDKHAESSVEEIAPEPLASAPTSVPENTWRPRTFGQKIPGRGRGKRADYEVRANTFVSPILSSAVTADAEVETEKEQNAETVVAEPPDEPPLPTSSASSISNTSTTAAAIVVAPETVPNLSSVSSDSTAPRNDTFSANVPLHLQSDGEEEDSVAPVVTTQTVLRHKFKKVPSKDCSSPRVSSVPSTPIAATSESSSASTTVEVRGFPSFPTEPVPSPAVVVAVATGSAPAVQVTPAESEPEEDVEARNEAQPDVDRQTDSTTQPQPEGAQVAASIVAIANNNTNDTTQKKKKRTKKAHTADPQTASSDARSTTSSMADNEQLPVSPPASQKKAKPDKKKEGEGTKKKKETLKEKLLRRGKVLFPESSNEISSTSETVQTSDMNDSATVTEDSVDIG